MCAYSEVGQGKTGLYVYQYRLYHGQSSIRQLVPVSGPLAPSIAYLDYYRLDLNTNVLKILVESRQPFI